MTISSIQGVEATPPTPYQQSSAPQKAELGSLVVKPFYFSPALTVDPKTGTAVLEIRNASTGAVITQYPSQKDLDAYAQNSLKSQSDAPAAAAKIVKANDEQAAATPDAPLPSAQKAAAGQSVIV